MVSYKVLYENSVLVGFSFLSVVIVLLVQGRFNDLIRIYFTAVWRELASMGEVYYQQGRLIIAVI